jgi:hypothetical protein
MITGKGNIIAYFEQTAKPYFALFYKGLVEKGNTIRRNDKDGEKDQDLAQGKECFERTLELLSYGEYTVIIGSEKDVTKRGGTRVDFKIPVSEAGATSAAPVAGIGYVSADEVDTRAKSIATTMFEQLMDKRELADTKTKLAQVEKDLKEAEKKAVDPWNKFMTAVAPHSDKIIQGFFPNSTAPIAALRVSGAEADFVGEADLDGQKIVEDFTQAIAAAKPNEWKSILTKVTDLIKADPEKFEMVLKFL